MPYEFQTVDLSVFDYHPAIAPLESSGLIQNDVNFLVDETDYNTRYVSGKEIQKPHFNIRPMKWRLLTYHHFWKYYQAAWYSEATPDFWKLQMPFVCHPVQADMKLITGSANFEGRVRAVVFLSGIGWSTNLDMRLRGAIKPGQLRDFVNKLVVNAPVFEIDGAVRSLTNVFERFSEQIVQDVYTPKLVDTVRIKRHFIISLSEFSGDINSYRSQGLGVKQMPASDRAMMHSILKGRDIQVPEVIKLEKEKKFLQTDFIGPDFALTYFQHGTLIFLQRAALKGTKLWQKKRSAMRCHASNIRNYCLMTLALHRFHADTAKHSGKKNKVDFLRKYVERTLSELPARYDNPLCQTFHLNYGPTKEMVVRE